MRQVSRLLSPFLGGRALVGRDPELAALASAVCEPPAVVSVEGMAGVGKTRLVAELTGRSELAGRRLLTGRCQQIRESFPLGPVIEAVRGIALEAGVALSPVAGALRPLLPELAGALPSAPEPPDDREAQRHQVFRGLVDLLGAPGPVVLVLDDLHWADEQTADFVAYLLATAPPGLALVVTYRNEDASPAVRALTARSAAGMRRLHIGLSPLGEDDTGALAASILGMDQLSAEFAAFLHERTGGVPFAVEELLEVVKARGLLVRRPGGGWVRRALPELEVPRSIRDTTLERVAGLSRSARRLADAAAVLSTPMAGAELIAVVSSAGDSTPGSECADPVEALEEALAAGLLVEQSGRIGFRHPLAAQAVYENLSGPRRADLHARAAAVLGKLDPEPLGQIAHHLKHAGRRTEWAEAAERAADQAAELGNDEEVVRLLGDVLRCTDGDITQRGRLAVKLGRAAMQTLYPGDVVDVLSGVLAQDPAPAVRGELRLLLSTMLHRSGEDMPRQRRLLAEAVSELGEQPELQARAMVALGLPIAPDVPMSEHLEWVNRSLTVVERAKNPRLEVLVLGNAGGVLVSAGDPRWRLLAERIRHITGGAPRRHREASAHYSVGVEACHAGHLRTAEVLLSEGLAALDARENHRLRVMMRSALALLAYYRGQWDGLSEECEVLIEEQADYPCGRVDVDAVAGCLALAHGDVDGSLRRLDDVLKLSEQIGGFEVLQMAGDAAARAWLFRGDAQTAADTVRRCLAVVAAKGLWAPAGRLLATGMEALVLAGDRGEAVAIADQFSRELHGSDAPLASAALCHAQGILTESAEKLRDAARRYEAIPAPYEGARALEQAARHAAGSADERAADDVRRAAATYRRQGATWDYNRIAALARSVGVPLPSLGNRGRKGYGGALSPQERRVAGLAAVGRTNREIAAELFLSPSTVEKHLVAAQRKLHAGNRTELGHLLAKA